MHIGPIPTQPTVKYTVHVPVSLFKVNGETLYQKIGLGWPNLKAAEEFQKAYEQANARFAGKTIVVEQTTTWTIVSDYAHDAGQSGKIPAQRGLQRERSDRDALRGVQAAADGR